MLKLNALEKDMTKPYPTTVPTRPHYNIRMGKNEGQHKIVRNHHLLSWPNCLVCGKWQAAPGKQSVLTAVVKLARRGKGNLGQEHSGKCLVLF